MRDIDAAEDWLDSWTAGVNEQARAAADLARQVSALHAGAESRDGAIRVTVGSTGRIERLELADDELAERIMQVMRAAQARLASAVAATVEQTVGADTDTGRAVVHSFESRFPAPPPPSDDHER